jgi:hypothetical protein
MKWTKKLAGALLALALCLALVAPASAAPVMPLLFSGDVTIGGVNAPIDTSITAEIEGTQVATATTTIVGRYVISIDYDSGYIGKTVTLKVEGAVGGSGTYVDPMTTPVVTVNLAVAGVTTYTLTMAVSGSGSTTPAVGDHDYTTGTVVDIIATPAGGWQFDSWTGAVADPTSATTTVTMNADKTVTANFELITPPGEGKLIGADDATGSNETLNYIFLTKFQAVATGQITEFREKSGIAGQVKVAIYADSGGEPGARLSYNNTAQNVVVGWNTLSIPALDVITGTYYWLGIIIDTSGAVQYIPSAVFFRYKAATFSTFTWPDPAGSSYYSAGGCELVAGWGGTVALGAPPIPTPLPPTKPVTFSWTAPTGATKYQLQVNTDSGFSGTSLFDSEVTATTQIVAVPIATTCYWHVKAGNAADLWSDWSSTGTVLP